MYRRQWEPSPQRRRTLELSASLTALLAMTALSGCSSSDSLGYTHGDIENASDFQQAILSDGKVDPYEYRQAISAEKSCVEAAGYRTTEIYSVGSQLTFDSEATYDNEIDPDAADEKFLNVSAQCHEEHSQLVGKIWAKTAVLVSE